MVADKVCEKLMVRRCVLGIGRGLDVVVGEREVAVRLVCG